MVNYQLFNDMEQRILVTISNWKLLSILLQLNYSNYIIIAVITFTITIKRLD